MSKLNIYYSFASFILIVGAVFTSLNKMEVAKKQTINFCAEQGLGMAGPYTCLQGDEPIFTEDL